MADANLIELRLLNAAVAVGCEVFASVANGPHCHGALALESGQNSIA